MNKVALTKQISIILLGFGWCIIPANICAEAPPSSPAQLEDECSQEILLAYFPGVFVKETLAKYNVPKEKWDAINKDLAARDKQIIKIVEEKASKMSSNPLKDPQQRQAAVKIFRETLSENFTAAMKANGVTDDKQIHAMLDDIQQQKAKRFARCMQQQQMPKPQSAPAGR